MTMLRRTGARPVAGMALLLALPGCYEAAVMAPVVGGAGAALVVDEEGMGEADGVLGGALASRPTGTGETLADHGGSLRLSSVGIAGDRGGYAVRTRLELGGNSARGLYGEYGLEAGFGWRPTPSFGLGATFGAAFGGFYATEAELCGSLLALHQGRVVRGSLALTGALRSGADDQAWGLEATVSPKVVIWRNFQLLVSARYQAQDGGGITTLGLGMGLPLPVPE